MSQTTYLIAHFRAAEGQRAALKSLLEGLVPITRAERGCIRYDLWQHRDDPDAFRLVETWASESDLESHLEAPHLMHAKQAFKRLLAEPLTLEFFHQLA